MSQLSSFEKIFSTFSSRRWKFSGFLHNLPNPEWPFSIFSSASKTSNSLTETKSYPCFQHFTAWPVLPPTNSICWSALPVEKQLPTPLRFSPAPLFYCCAPVSFYTPSAGWLILIWDDQMSSNSGSYTPPHRNSHYSTHILLESFLLTIPTPDIQAIQ